MEVEAILIFVFFFKAIQTQKGKEKKALQELFVGFFLVLEG